MKRDIVTYPDPILHKVASPVSEVDAKVRALLDDMAETMYAADGVGIAAPQIGVGLRVAVIDIGDKGPGILKMINPEIISRDGEIEWDEGCLSVPEFRAVVKRSRRLTLHYLDENGLPRELEAEGLLAVAIQQEMDHLNGRLIIDSVSRLKQDMYFNKRKKQG